MKKRWFSLPLAIGLITPVAFIAACAQTSSTNLDAEIARLENLQLQAINQKLTQEQFSQIDKTNLANYVLDFDKQVNRAGFVTKIMDLKKNQNRIQFNFKVDEQATGYQKTTKNIWVDFQVENIEPLPPVIAGANGWAPITNTDAASAKQYPINHADQYHFNRPFYENGKVTLKQNGSAANNVPTPGVPSQQNVYAKEGWMPTAQHAQLAKQVFSVGFVEDGGVEQTGTAWILDYKLTEDKSYPLTWFFGTNAHVIDDLRVDGEPIYKEKFATWDPKQQKYRAVNTRRLNLWRLLDPQAQTEYRDSNRGGWDSVAINLIDPSLEDDWWNKKEGFYLKEPPVKTIFQGFDFLSTSPSQFSALNPWKDKEEYADFGVFEVNFENETQARLATNNYADWSEKDKFKYRTTDLVNHPENIPQQVFEVGYPTDGFIRNLATNTNKLLYDQGQTVQTNALTQSPNYATWTHLNGAFDAHIAMSDFGYAYEWMDNTQSDLNKVKTSTPYVGYGLIYGAEGSNMRGGSSGALSIDQDGYAIGIHYASDNNSAMGGTQAFVSQGYDYKGYYGNYNLPAYDLIRGGGQYQTASYYDNLVKIYGKNPNFKTRLFPNGLTSRY